MKDLLNSVLFLFGTAPPSMDEGLLQLVLQSTFLRCEPQEGNRVLDLLCIEVGGYPISVGIPNKSSQDMARRRRVLASMQARSVDMAV